MNAYGWQNKPASVAMKFDDVARPGSQYLPAAGSSITEFKKGETVNWSTTVDVSKVKNLENYSIVAMLVNKDRNIIENAFMAKGVTSGIEAVAAEGNAVAIGVQGGVNMFTAGNIYTIDGGPGRERHGRAPRRSLHRGHPRRQRQGDGTLMTPVTFHVS